MSTESGHLVSLIPINDTPQQYYGMVVASNVFSINDNGAIDVLRFTRRVRPCELRGSCFVSNRNLQNLRGDPSGALVLLRHNGLLRAGVVVEGCRESMNCLVLVSKFNHAIFMVDRCSIEWLRSFEAVHVSARMVQCHTVQQISGKRIPLDTGKLWDYPYVGKDHCISTTYEYPGRILLPESFKFPTGLMPPPDPGSLLLAKAGRSSFEFRTYAKVIYVDETEDLKGTSGGTGLFGMVWGEICRTNEYKAMNVFKLKKEDIQLLGKMRKRVKANDVTAFLMQQAVEVSSVLVPLYSGELRVKAVSSFEFKTMKAGSGYKKVRFNGREYLFGEEKGETHNNPGILFCASVANCPAVLQQRITYRCIEAFDQVYGLGYDRRQVSDSCGSNVYRGERGTARSGETATVAKEHVGFQQYCNSRFCFPLCQVFTDDAIQQLASAAGDVASILNSQLFSLVKHACSKLIATFGSPSASLVEDSRSGAVWSPNPLCLLAFCNECHSDEMDDLSVFRGDVKEKELSAYQTRLVDSDYFAVPTTIGYQVVYGEDCPSSLPVFQYFVCEGAGLALPIKHGTCNHFIGSAFSHFSSMAYCVCPDGRIAFSNTCSDILSIVAFGATGGKKQFRSFIECNDIV